MWAAAPLLLLLLPLLLLGRRWRREAAALEPAGRAVLITGCDSGFGHLLALRLHRLGFTVFAGCLCPGGEGARRLQREAAADAGRMRVLRLDVTRGRDVLAAKELLAHVGERWLRIPFVAAEDIPSGRCPGNPLQVSDRQSWERNAGMHRRQRGRERFLGMLCESGNK
uniref:Uncharacterized protein n=1 Tax=Pavo cristatus TaxID=9049 RepID=A0A8C9G880_PAVCR